LPIDNRKEETGKEKDKESEKHENGGNNELIGVTKGQQTVSGKNVVIRANGVSYVAEKIVGNGSFGVVFQASVVGTGERVAIKKVLQDKRFKNRELQIMRLLHHPNVVQLENSFLTNSDRADEVFLNLVLEYVPETVYRISRHYSKLKQPIPLIYVKLYIYQLCRSLAYIHSLGICHRDIKPQNLLLDPPTGVLKLCDFGSAKILVKGEPNVSYICSRYYRAPELLFGSTTYSCAIDIWSMGCVLGELLLGHPLFPGDSGVDQLVEIIKALGTPTKEQIWAMTENCTDFKFPQIRGHSWSKIFRSNTPPDAIDLLSKFLQYTPSERLLPIDACAHSFFDELRDPNTVLPNMRPLPPLFNFTESELAAAKHIPRGVLIPPHANTTITTSNDNSSANTFVPPSPNIQQATSALLGETSGTNNRNSDQKQEKTNKPHEFL